MVRSSVTDCQLKLLLLVLLLVLLLLVQVRYFQRLPENLKRLQAVAARMAKSGLVSGQHGWAVWVGVMGRLAPKEMKET